MLSTTTIQAKPLTITILRTLLTIGLTLLAGGSLVAAEDLFFAGPKNNESEYGLSATSQAAPTEPKASAVGASIELHWGHEEQGRTRHHRLRQALHQGRPPSLTRPSTPAGPFNMHPAPFLTKPTTL